MKKVVCCCNKKKDRYVNDFSYRKRTVSSNASLSRPKPSNAKIQMQVSELNDKSKIQSVLKSVDADANPTGERDYSISNQILINNILNIIISICLTNILYIIKIFKINYKY